jgi:hypothetical protein
MSDGCLNPLVDLGAAEHLALSLGSLEARRRPPLPRDEAERLRPPRRSSSVRKVHNASGIPDVIVDGGQVSSLPREQEGNVERPSGLVGYEEAGEPIGEDDEADA